MKDVIRQTVNVVSKTVRFGFEVLREGVALIADAPAPTPEEEASNSAAGGGVLNYRTDRFDNGTDPAGWYEHD